MKKKLIYIWDYYKFVIALLICLIVVSISIAIRLLTPNPSLYVGFVNIGVGADLKEKIITDYPSKILTYDNLVLTENTDADNVQYVFASQTKILSTIAGEEFDIVFLTEEALGAFGQNGYLLNMEDYMVTNLPELSQKVSYVSNVDLSEESAKEYPMAIDISNYEVIKAAKFTEPVYLGIIANTKRIEAVNQYINFLLAQ